MTLTGLSAYLATNILQRPELANTAELTVAINAGHLQLQMDGDFRCMEKHVIVTVPANTIEGVAIAADYKRARHVWNTLAGVRTSPVTPAVESEINLLALTAKQTRGLDSLTTGNGYYQRWFERELKLCLLIPPAASTNLLVDYYAYLPDYAAPTDSDYFSTYYWLCLLYCAAWQASLTMFEDSRASLFQQTYATLLKQAIANDQGIKEGGKKSMGEAAAAPTGGK